MELERYKDIQLGSVVLFVDPDDGTFLRDGRVTWITERANGVVLVDVAHLGGYRSLNDTLPYDELVAVVDDTSDIVEFPGYRGHFKVLREGFVNRPE